MKQKIQKSMMLILLVTLFPFYVIMTVILYNQNLGILEKEVQQEAVYLSSGVDVAGEEYLKKLEPMIKADEDTRLTFISQSGDVLYDSDSSKTGTGGRTGGGYPYVGYGRKRIILLCDPPG